VSKFLKVGLPVALVGVIALAGATAAFAQAEPPQPPYAGRGPGRGPGGGLLAEYNDILHAKLAEALGMSLSDFEAARAEGTPLAALAAEQGVSLEDLREVMLEARSEMIQEALADGVITQEQSDWMLQRGALGHGPGAGQGLCDGTGPHGARGFGRAGG